MDIKFLNHFKKIAVIISLLFLFGAAGCQDIGNHEDTRSQISGVKAADTNSNNDSRELTVHYMDVGQGDAALIICGEDAMLNDAGDNSIALLLTYGDIRFYFEGDVGEEEEAQILSSGTDVRADVYKIGHHGSKTSTTDAMLAAVNPACAVISAGEDNRYGHPHAEVLNKLRMNGIKTFRTDEQGTVVAKSDGKNIVFNMSSSDTWQAGERF